MLVDFPKGRRSFDTEVGQGDTYYLEGDYTSAITSYEAVIGANPSNKNLSIVYYRLGQCYNQARDNAKAHQYFDKVKRASPLSFEARTFPVPVNLEDENSCGAPKGYYSVQLGAFKTKTNAENFLSELSKKSYGECYIETLESSDMTLYKVRVGRYASRSKAEGLAARLKDDGYKTKICP